MPAIKAVDPNMIVGYVGCIFPWKKEEQKVVSDNKVYMN
jgi:hypothetical protein